MLQTLHEIIWGPGMLVLFLAAGLLYSVRLGFFPILGIRTWWQTTAGSLLRGSKDQKEGGISEFQSACTALAATIGTGNIAGVATALLAGGPGAVFWMWLSAFLGMGTAYGETELGIRYRRRDKKGKWLSGPMLYLEQGLKLPGLAVLYAVLCILASFGMGSMVQANAISETLEFTFSVSPALSGVLLAVLAGRIVTGGIGRIARASERLAPVSAAIYILASLSVIAYFWRELPAVFAMIFKDAFAIRSAAGGVSGFGVSRCVRYGIARGVFSNEAGLGSLAVLNGGTDRVSPGVQGQWAIFEVFVDTIVCCTLTALAILSATGGELGAAAKNGAALTSACFTRGLGNLGGYAVSVCVVLFAFATILAWYYMGKQAVTYLEEKTGHDFSYLYLAGYLTAVFLGSLGPMEQVWQLSDIFNGLMAMPNLLALAFLVREVKRP
ncbi:MAG: sodium:alanine symporter family protein [Lachnospiraceae bacterium]|jgi:AGCS family alanine or glycine:cation symporter|nr:sodium:alanine symporter family protein [Lachnospiraceae bacterium]